MPGSEDHAPGPGPILVVGAGGHAKVVIEILRAAGGDVAGLVAADPAPRQVLGARVLGSDADLARLRGEGLARAVVAVGDNTLRQRLAGELRAAGFALVNAVHPAATISPSAAIGAGAAVMAGAVVNADARVGDLAIVNTGACVDHDGDLGQASHVGPRCGLAGGVVLGARVLLGVGVSVIPGVTIGADAVVGAGAAVVADVPAGALAMGVPARVVRAAGRPGRTA